MNGQQHGGDGADAARPGASGAAAAAGDVRVALTVLSHPDLGRVGDRRMLAELDHGGVAEISRLHPAFTPRGDVAGVAAAPLGDPYVSRTPFRFRRSADGGVVLECGESHTRVEVDGERCLLGRELGRAELLRGVVLLLANRVVLLLHGLWPDEPQAQNRKLEITRLLYRYLRNELSIFDRATLLADPGPYAQPWLPAPVVAKLVRYPWPGEKYQIKAFVRRLVHDLAGAQHVADEAHVERLLVEATDGADVSDDSSDHTSPFILGDGYVSRDASEVSERELMQALLRNRWQLGPTARQLGVSRPTLFMMIDEMTAPVKQRLGR